MDDVIKTVIGAVATIAVAYLGYLGVSKTASAARRANSEPDMPEPTPAQTDSAYRAWEELVRPVREQNSWLADQLQALRGEVAQVRSETTEQVRQARERVSEVERTAAHQLEQMRVQSDRWQAMARVLLRWGLRQQAVIERAKLDPVDVPDELEAIRAIIDV